MSKYILLLIIFFITGCQKSPEREYYRKLIKQGDVLFAKGEITLAVEKWEESLSIKKSKEIYEKIVAGLILDGKNEKAKEFIEEGLTYFPNCVNLIFNLSYINVIKGEYKQAVENIDKLLGINKYYPEAHYLKGVALEKMGKLKEAKREYIKEININPGNKKAWKRIKEIKDEKI